VLGAAYFLWRRFQDRLENDAAFARRLKAVREARKALVPAGEYISMARPKIFMRFYPRLYVIIWLINGTNPQRPERGSNFKEFKNS